MTERLYYTDSYCMDFESTICAVQPLDGSTSIRLETTYFYPTSGGQPHDLGAINGWPVTDVRIAADGGVDHQVAAQLDPAQVGSRVQASIDRRRRYDFMQQHSGQHLISQCFYQVLGLETLSVHFGEAHSTLDVDAPEVDVAGLRSVERLANEQAYAALPIRAYFVDDGELQKLPLRKRPHVDGNILIVEIDRFDYSACGGTHCRSTAELGPVKFLRQEKRGKGARITFVCGWRALDDYSQRIELLNSAASHFSTDPAEVPTLIARVQRQLRAAEKQNSALSERLIRFEADASLANAQHIGAVRVVVQRLDDRDIAAVKNLAISMCETPATVALLAHSAQAKLGLVFACSEELPLNMGELLRETLQQFGGSGGGRPQLAQGGGVAVAQAEPLLASALSAVQSQLLSGESVS